MWCSMLRKRRRQLSRLLNLSREVLVFEVWRQNQLGKGIAEKELILAVIEAEAHFVQVGREMLRRDFMPCAHDSTFEKAKGRFDCVGMNVPMSIFAGVVNGFMAHCSAHFVQCPRINSRFISHNDFHIFADMLADNLANGRGFGILSSDQPQIPIALANPDNNGLLALWPPAAFLAAYVGFINFDRAIQRFGRYFQHGRADAVAEIPCCLVADSERAWNLAGRHPLFGFAEQISC